MQRFTDWFDRVCSAHLPERVCDLFGEWSVATLLRSEEPNHVADRGRVENPLAAIARMRTLVRISPTTIPVGTPKPYEQFPRAQHCHVRTTST